MRDVTDALDELVVVKLCECGCGEATSLASQTRADQGHVRGKPMRYVAGHGGGTPAVVHAGEVYGRLTVVAEAGRGKPGHRTYLCRCDCGGETVVSSDNLRRGKTRSCGCLCRESAAENGRASSTVHGHTSGGETPTYRSWVGMIQRCTNQNSVSWKNYGGRGIAVCDRWRDSFEGFLVDMGERPEGKTLDRIDNDGDYEPGNCKWSTPAEQVANRRPK